MIPVNLRMQSKIVWDFKIHQNRFVWKKLHETSKDNKIPSRFGYAGQNVTYNKCRNFCKDWDYLEIREFPRTGIFSCYPQLGL